MIKDYRYILRLAGRFHPARPILEFFYQLSGNVNWIFYSIIFIRVITRSMEGRGNFPQMAVFVVGSGLLFAAVNYFTSWYQSYFKEVSNARIYEGMSRMLFEKAANVELECFENPQFYNKYTLAMKDAIKKLPDMMENCMVIVVTVLTAVFVLWQMMLIDRYVILFAAFPLIGNFVFGKWLSRVLTERNAACVPGRRKVDYVTRCLSLKDYAKEIRMTNIYNVLRRIHEAGYRQVVEEIDKNGKKASFLGFWKGNCSFLFMFQGVAAYSLYRTMVSKTMHISDFAVISGAMVVASWSLIHLASSLQECYQDVLYAKAFREFVEYEPRIPGDQKGILPEGKNCTITFSHVSFTYPGTDKAVLRDINLTLENGKTAALVGINGAGKTTLVKLLLRLYDPDEGVILYNGTDIRQLDLTAYRNLIGAAFQDFQLFSMTVAENVLLHSPTSEEEYETAKKVLKQAGIWEKITQLPQGMDTVLTREFAQDGANLSGGQMQKIAAARVFAGDYGLAVFDEPSSALDPKAEYELFEQILKYCQNRTTLFISHRLSAARLVDCVYVLEDGRILEAGSHEELMKCNGRYREIFEKQSVQYLKGEEVTV